MPHRAAGMPWLSRTFARCDRGCSRDAGGAVEIWMNGTRVAEISGPTASPLGTEQFYHKVGLYRDRMTEPMTIHFDDDAVGNAFEAVDPARFDDREWHA